MSLTQTNAGSAAVVELVLAAPALAGGVHKLAKVGRGAQRLLRPAVEGLPAAGVGGFQYGDLLTPLQQRVREAARLWAGEPHPAAEEKELAGRKIRLAVPTERYSEFDEYLASLAARVRAEIDGGGSRSGREPGCTGSSTTGSPPRRNPGRRAPFARGVGAAARAEAGDPRRPRPAVARNRRPDHDRGGRHRPVR